MSKAEKSFELVWTTESLQICSKDVLMLTGGIYEEYITGGKKLQVKGRASPKNSTLVLWQLLILIIGKEGRKSFSSILHGPLISTLVPTNNETAIILHICKEMW